MGYGGVGTWYKYRRFLPGTIPLGRAGGPEDGVKYELTRGTVFPGA